MLNRYDILESISQGKDGTMPEENADMVHVANIIAGATRDIREDEKESRPCPYDVAEQNEREQRIAEQWAKQSDRWIPMEEIFKLGVPGPSGSESDTYIARDVYVYKTNNLMHCGASILIALERFIDYNTLFPDSAYTLVGFAGFDGRGVYPVVRQRYIKDGVPATQTK